MDYKNYFKDKKVTLLGLGLLGRGVGDAEFLARHGTELIVTDLKTKEQLASSLARLKGFSNISYRLGGHDLADFRGRDFILKAAGVPLDSPFVAEARKNGIAIEMDASLFVKLAPAITTIGITGTRGKSTTVALIYEILKAAGKRVFLAGNIKDTATLPLLEKIQEGDTMVLELDSWQLQGFGDAKMSPHISVFTTFLPDHMNYYKDDMEAYFDDKANIFKYQNVQDHLVVGEDIAEKFTWGKGQLHVAHVADVPKDFLVHLPGEHSRLNAACALAVGGILGIEQQLIQSTLKEFKGLPGRLELKRVINDISYYNDTNATTPTATLAGLRAVSRDKNVVLIMGGADKGLDMSGLVAEIPQHCKAVVLLAGSGTEQLKASYPELAITTEAKSLDEALQKAKGFATKGDVVLFSPAFASFGMFKNEYDRGEQFNVLLAELN